MCYPLLIFRISSNPVFSLVLLKDVQVGAVVSDCGNVVHISVGMCSRSTSNSEKEWHVSNDTNYL